jgi:hypothetical protein
LKTLSLILTSRTGKETHPFSQPSSIKTYPWFNTLLKSLNSVLTLQNKVKFHPCILRAIINRQNLFAT